MRGHGSLYLFSQTIFHERLPCSPAPPPRAGLLAGALTLALAAPAGAATVEWLVGPLGLDAGKAAQVAISDPELFPCQVGVRILAGPASRIATGVTTAAMAVVANTSTNLPAGGVQVVGFTDPDIMPGERRLVTATVQANCRGITAAQIRDALAVTLQIGDPNLGQTTAALAAQAR